MPVYDRPVKNPQVSDNNAMNDNSAPVEFSVQFWGVRGNIATPGHKTVRYGGIPPVSKCVWEINVLFLTEGLG
ncbi:hypothetical protein APLC1_3960 [Limnospira platensis C1]|nr:hypothetical protein APLC1_3960 [Arthrospira platensis C1]